MAHTIVYITPSTRLLGARISLLRLLERLDKTRFTPYVITPRKGPICGELDKLGISWKPIRFGNWRKVKHWPRIPVAIYNIVELCREISTSLIHSNEFWSFPYAHLAAERLGIPAICHFRCSRTPDQLPPGKLRKYFLHKADHLIAISNYQKQYFTELPELQKKISIVPNGVEIKSFQIEPDKNLRRTLGIPDSGKVIGFIGLISPHKGIEDFLYAGREILKKTGNVFFLIAGPAVSDTYSTKIDDIVEMYNMTDHVFRLGFRSDIPQIMKLLDLLAVPSRQEAFGRIIIEAMATGIPVVATTVGGIPEIINSMDIGRLVPPETPDELAKILLELIDDDSLRNHLSGHALDRISTVYSLENHIASIQKIYDSIYTEA